MDLIQAALLGMLQGLTEWLPISSSGHLVLAQRWMGLTVPVAFDVFLHLGTLTTVIAFFRGDLLGILRALAARDVRSEDFRLFAYVVVGMVPTAIIGFALTGFFESLFSSTLAVGIGLLITGVLLLLSRAGSGRREVGWLAPLVMGIAQGMAIAPGVSRSGSTISLGLLIGVKKEEVFRLSFLLSIPAILGASLFKIGELTSSDLGPHAVLGLVVAAASGYVAIKIVQRALLSERLYLFSLYCFLAGAAVLLLQ